MYYTRKNKSKKGPERRKASGYICTLHHINHAHAVAVHASGLFDAEVSFHADTCDAMHCNTTSTPTMPFV